MIKMPKRAVFLDRDGTINLDPGYLKSIEEFVFLPQAVDGLKLLQEAGFCLVVITNQSGIARGYFTVEDLDKVHRYMEECLGRRGIILKGIYYCPHHPEKGNQPYVQKCNCRKPGTALLEQAARELGIDLARSYLVGDKMSDIGAGVAAGCQAVLVLTGEGEKTLAKSENWQYEPKFIADNLYGAACWILADSGRRKE